MKFKTILIILQIIVCVLYINTIQAQSGKDTTTYVFLQGGYFNTNDNPEISGFGTINMGYLKRSRPNVLRGFEIDFKKVTDKEIIGSVPTFLDTISSMRLVGGNISYTEISLNYVRAREYVSSEKIGFGLMSGLGGKFKNKEIDPRAAGGVSSENSYAFHFYTGPYLNVVLSNKFSLLFDWNVFDLSAAVTTDDFTDENGVFLEQGPFFDIDLNLRNNNFHIGIKYTL